MRSELLSFVGAIVLVVSQARGDTRVAGARTSPARDDLVRSGCKQVGERFDCTTMAARNKARAYLARGAIADYTIDTFGGTDRYPAPANKYEATTTPNVTLVAREADRGGGSSSGSVAYSVDFDVVRWGPAPSSQCNPSCSALPPTKCARKTQKQDAVRVPLNGPTGGLFSIAASQLGAPITGSFKASDDDQFRAWDACQRAAAWGKTTSLELRFRVSALFHIDDWKTQAVPGGCTASNVDALVNPTVDLAVPVTVTCQARPRAQIRPRVP
jgi:hypothetical protein